MCATMIVDGFQPQTCTGAWCVMRWRTRCELGVIHGYEIAIISIPDTRKPIQNSGCIFYLGAPHTRVNTENTSASCSNYNGKIKELNFWLETKTDLR